MNIDIKSRPAMLYMRDLAAVALCILFITAQAGAQTEASTGSDAAFSNSPTEDNAEQQALLQRTQFAGSTSAETIHVPTTLRVANSTGRAGIESHAPELSKELSEPQAAKSRVVVQQSTLSGFEIFESTVDIFYDDDNDGYYHALEVVFDADTDFVAADVFARLYLSLEGGPWEHYFTTNAFTLFGNSADDYYSVETELAEGYPTGYYDVLIELYDADYGDFVASLGPSDTDEQIDLPLEDQFKDSVIIISPGISHSHGGGGTSLLVLTLLMIATMYRLRPIGAASSRDKHTG